MITCIEGTGIFGNDENLLSRFDDVEIDLRLFVAVLG